jgi:hypothetical protein
MVYTYHKNRQRLSDIYRLWLRRCDKVYIFSDEQWVDPFFNYSTVEVHPDNTSEKAKCLFNHTAGVLRHFAKYRKVKRPPCGEKNLWGKLSQMWSVMNKTWCVPHRGLKAEKGRSSSAQSDSCDQIDFLLVSGDDTFVILENLREYLDRIWTLHGAKERPSRPLYIGNFFQKAKREHVASRDPARGDLFTYASGAGYLINWATLQELMRCPPAVLAERTFAEDKMLGVCLEHRGLLPSSGGSVSALPRDPGSVSPLPLPFAIDAGLLVLTNGLPRSPKQVQAGTFLVHNIFGKRLYALSECIYGIGSKRKCIAKGSLFARMRVGELALPLSLSRENISRYIANISQYANISLPISLSHSTVFVTLALLFHFWI